jgi:hypothetical protein
MFSIIIQACSHDMPKEDRVINDAELKRIKNIALINFSINRNCTIGSGEDIGFVDDLEQIRYFGKYHLAGIYELTKSSKSPSFLDLNQMVKSENYKKLELPNYYVKGRNEKLPKWLSPGKHFMNIYEGVGIIKLNHENSRKICTSLKTDAVLSVEVTYALDNSFNIPILGNFIKPKWSAQCKIKSELYNSQGELIWQYESVDDSPIKIKANKSLNLVLYSSSSITGKQTEELIRSVADYSSEKIMDTLTSDLNY